MNLALSLTARCNAACAHCSTSCAPGRTERFGRVELFNVMREAATLADGAPLKFALTGGEPFLDFAWLLEVVAYGTGLGGDVTCVTNGYWATSDSRAQEQLGRLKSAGLKALAVSTSRFHQQFVKRPRVARVLQAARALGIDCTLKYIRVRSDPDDAAAIRHWAATAGANEIQDIALLPYLREGHSLPEDEYLREEGLPEGGCPGAIMTIREDGQSFACCTPGAETPFFSLGDIEQGLEAISDRFYLDGRMQLLRARGPAHFARAVVAAGLGGRLRTSYTSVCDLCVHIASDPAMAAVAEEASHQFELQQLDEILMPLVSDVP